MNPLSLGYEFAPTNGGDETGIDPVTTIFKGDFNFLAREALQNIIDAANSTTDLPARASFEIITISSNQLPEVKSLKKIFEACWRSVRNYQREAKFYIEALENLRYGREPIHLLKISDFNTRGMTYKEDDPECDYHVFMKRVGTSVKSSSEGGSWGLGKGAYFAASSFRMIFMSSIFDKNKYIFQGKLRLTSFIDPDTSQMMQGNGSFGLFGQKPVTDPTLIPSMFKRKEQGTDIYIVGFDKKKNWEELITKSVLNNFWPAIYKGILQVEVNGNKIEKENLDEKIHNYYTLDKTDTEKDPNPLPYYHAYTDSNKKAFYEGLPTLKNVDLYVLEDNKFVNRVACIRSTGMIIQKVSKLLTKKYAAVFECDNEVGNTILQRMENPTHTEWKSANDPNYYIEPPKDLIRAEKEFNDFIKRNLKKITEMPDTNFLAIKGLEKYLGIPSDEGYASGSPYEVSPLGVIKITEEERGIEINKSESVIKIEQPKIKPVIFTAKIKEAEEGKGEDIFVGKGTGGNGIREGEKTAEEGNIKRMVAIPIRYRTFCSKNSDNQNEHIFILRGKANSKIDLEVRACTDDGTIPVDVKSVEDIDGSLIKFNGHWIKEIDLQQKETVKLRVIFEEKEKLALFLRAYANK